MKQILDSLKAEFITISDDDSGKSFTVRTWHVLLAVFVLGWLIG